jgi:hypothetical protein
MVPIFTVAVTDKYAYQAACLAATMMRFGCRPKIFTAKLSEPILDLLTEVADEIIPWDYPQNSPVNGSMKAHLGPTLAEYSRGIIVDADTACTFDPYGRLGPIDFISTMPGLYCNLHYHTVQATPRPRSYATLASDARGVGGIIGWNGRPGASALRMWKQCYDRETGQQFWDDEISLGYVFERFPELFVARVIWDWREKATYADTYAGGSPQDIQGAWDVAKRLIDEGEGAENADQMPPWWTRPSDGPSLKGALSFGPMMKWAVRTDVFELFEGITDIPRRMAELLGHDAKAEPDQRFSAECWIARATKLQDALEAAGVSSIICGSVALAIQGWQIPINDVDLILHHDQEAITKAFEVFNEMGWACNAADAERCVRLGLAQHNRGPYRLDICTGRNMSGLRRPESIEKYLITHKGRRVMRAEGVFLTRSCRGRNADHALWEHATPPPPEVIRQVEDDGIQQETLG